jgi:hypothetical protein
VFVAHLLVHCILLPFTTDICPTTVQVLGQGAVHGAFAGYTGFTVGLVNTHYVYLPIPGNPQAPPRTDAGGRCVLRGHSRLVPTVQIFRLDDGLMPKFLLCAYAVVIQAPRTVDPKGRSYNRLITAINQPSLSSEAAACAY